MVAETCSNKGWQLVEFEPQIHQISVSIKKLNGTLPTEP